MMWLRRLTVQEAPSTTATQGANPTAGPEFLDKVQSAYLQAADTWDSRSRT